jgi:hypothetical protein
LIIRPSELHLQIVPSVPGLWSALQEVCRVGSRDLLLALAATGGEHAHCGKAYLRPFVCVTFTIVSFPSAASRRAGNCLLPACTHPLTTTALPSRPSPTAVPDPWHPSHSDHPYTFRRTAGLRLRPSAPFDLPISDRLSRSAPSRAGRHCATPPPQLLAVSQQHTARADF